METCANCGREIGNLEPAHIFNDNVVCGRCIAILKPPVDYEHSSPAVQAPGGVVDEFAGEWEKTALGGAKRRRTNWPLAIIVICLSPCLLCGIFSLIAPDKKSPSGGGTPSGTSSGSSSSSNTPKGFSAWDGSNYSVVKALKRNLNDPSSFEHVETRIWNQGGSRVVIMQYRAKNGFGAKVLQSVKARIDANGNLIEFFE